MDGSVIAAILFGVVLIAVGFAHPIGPALMFAAESPFDVIPFVLFGHIGNIVTFIPFLIFLARVNPILWGQVFFGTRIQAWFVLFIVLLLVSHAQGIIEHGIGEIIEWLRKVTLFVMLSVIAYAMSQTRHLGLFAKTLVVAMAAYTLLSAFDHYLGIQILPVTAGRLEAAALETEFSTQFSTGWRFTGAGLPVNRFSNYLLLPIFLGVGWFMSTRSPLGRAAALVCTSLLVLAEFLTVSRSGLLGLALGGMLLIPMAFRFQVRQMLGVIATTSVIAVIAWYGISLTQADEVLAMRFGVQEVTEATGGRIERILAGFKVWGHSPFIGVGWGSYLQYSHQYVSTSGKGAHNGYLRVLAEAGLLGFVPMMIVTIAIARRSFMRIAHLPSDLQFWRPYWVSALAAQLVTNVFNDYFWERHLWMTFAFVVAIEQCYLRARTRERQLSLEAEGSEPQERAPVSV